jgi:hypothetical protein
LAGFLAFFEVDDKSQAGTGGQRQILLRDAQLFPGFPDDLAEFLWRVFHGLTINVTVREYCRLFLSKVNKLLPYGNTTTITIHIMANIPVR